MGQERLLGHVDRILRLVDATSTHDAASPLARLWAVRSREHHDYPLGTRKLFLADRSDGYWAAFQDLFRAAGLPKLSTFDGPSARRRDELDLR